MNWLAKLIFCAFVCVFAGGTAHAQSDSTATEKDKRFKITPLPVVFYLPETRLAYGATVSYNFQLGKNDTISPVSQMQNAVVFTQNKQFLLWIPFNFYWKNFTRFVEGELGFYKYSYLYFGIGNKNQNPEGSIFNVDFPRFRFNGFFKLADKLYTGPRYWYENYMVAELSEDVVFDDLRARNRVGGVSSGVGWSLRFDSRDNVYESRSGAFGEVNFQTWGKAVGSSFTFSKTGIDLRKFWTVKENLTFATQLWSEFSTGQVPFQLMGFLGGGKRMRGFYEGRFRDRNNFILQAETRLRIRKRWAAHLFASSGNVWDAPNQFALNNTKVNAGAGIRFRLDPEKRVNIRVDYGISLTNASTGIYFTFGEAF